MIGQQPAPHQDYDDDGAGRLAILGVFLVLAVIAAGIALNMQL